MFTGCDTFRRPEDDFVLFGEALREIWPARVLKERRPVVDYDARWYDERQFMAIYLSDSVYFCDFFVRPFVALEESVGAGEAIEVNQEEIMEAYLPRYKLPNALHLWLRLIVSFPFVVMRLQLQ